MPPIVPATAPTVPPTTAPTGPASRSPCAAPLSAPRTVPCACAATGSASNASSIVGTKNLGDMIAPLVGTPTIWGWTEGLSTGACHWFHLWELSLDAAHAPFGDTIGATERRRLPGVKTPPFPAGFALGGLLKTRRARIAPRPFRKT